LFCYFLFSAFFSHSFSQCEELAGTDNVALIFCDMQQMFLVEAYLKTQLGSYPAGATWKDEDRSGGLNRTTGILNAQLIRRSGTYSILTQLQLHQVAVILAIVTAKWGGYTGVPLRHL
jgi:hypothetical protein